MPVAVLMYHEIERAGRPVLDDSPSYLRYVVREAAFLEQLDQLGTLGLAGVSVSNARLGTLRLAGVSVSNAAPESVALTFDDGCETDWLVAAPALQARGFGATFYVTTGFTGRPGYLDATALRELVDSGFELGTHGATHRFLSDLSDDELRRELTGPKSRLEELTGRAIVHLSCPGGRCDRRVLEAAAGAGYLSVATSRVGANAAGRFDIARTAMMRDTSIDAFEAVCRGRGQGVRRVQAALLDAAKRTLGSAGYDRARRWWIGGPPDRHSDHARKADR